VASTSAARDDEVRTLLSDLEGAFAGSAAALLTRAGSVFAGRTPTGAGRESFGAMMAVLHGASETGTQELGEPLETVEAHLSKGVVMLAAAGPKMILALHVKDGADAATARARVKDTGARLARLF
jgi:predicted regulator of Ras-like GTPase activity (Roadblock/LC7/MglB family)